MQTQGGLVVPGSAPQGGTLDYISALTRPGVRNAMMSNPTVDAAALPGGPPAMAETGASKKTAYWLIGLIILLVLAKIAAENKKGEKLEMHHVRISALNWLLITSMAVTGIVAGKAIINMNPKLSQSGLAKVLNAA